MFLERKNNIAEKDWQPSANLNTLRLRAKWLANIRQFFAEREILEVETPLLSRASVTDAHILSMPAIFQNIGNKNEITLYLQTSPEYAMKRLLAAGSGDIYQICKAFRQGEIGKLHNPEFTMLEWYRLNWDHRDLMNEVDGFLQNVFNLPSADKISYADIFIKYLDINPHLVFVAELIECGRKNNLAVENFHETDLNFWLDFLFSHAIEPNLGQERPCLIYDFPITQAALAKIRDDNPPVASRFELYYRGIELANGFHELQDAREQRQRFLEDLNYRKKNYLPFVPIDELFLAALTHGLPNCAGVALGLDRMMMLMADQESIAKVLSFDFTRA